MARHPLLLLPGMMLDREMWQAQIVALSDVSEPRVGDLTSGSSMIELAEAVLDEAPAKFDLAGFSMGAIVAMEIWRRSPERIRRLVLAGFSPLADAPERSVSRRADIERASSGGLAEMMTTKFVPNYFSESTLNRDRLADHVTAAALRQGAEVFRRQSLAQIGRADSRPSLASVSVPTLVICGREDRLSSLSDHELVAASIPESYLFVIAKAGHMVTLERSAAVNAVLRAFLTAEL